MSKRTGYGGGNRGNRNGGGRWGGKRTRRFEPRPDGRPAEGVEVTEAGAPPREAGSDGRREPRDAARENPREAGRDGARENSRTGTNSNGYHSSYGRDGNYGRDGQGQGGSYANSHNAGANNSNGGHSGNGGNRGNFNRNRRRGPQRRTGRGGAGIRAQSKGGKFGENWWARRWIENLESFDMGSRLNRGRDYAKNGHVLSISIDEGHVHARVRGSRPKPYDVDIRMQAIAEQDWHRVADKLAGQAVYGATLLAGEMPGDIEEIFRELNLSLYPAAESDLQTSCSCPDWANPCKHLAAVYLLLGEEFDRDPFLLFTLRGMRREKLLAIIEKHLPQAMLAEAREEGEEQAPPEEPKQLLPLDPDIFWKGSVRMPEDVAGEVVTPAIPAGLPRRLGPFPFWQGQRPLQEALEPVYKQASSHAAAFLLGAPMPDK